MLYCPNPSCTRYAGKTKKPFSSDKSFFHHLQQSPACKAFLFVQQTSLRVPTISNPSKQGSHSSQLFKKHCIRFPYNEASNLPIAKLAPGITKYQAFYGSANASSSPTPQHNDNLSPASRKLLRLHHRLGHKGFHEIQQWAAEGINDIPRDVATCTIPMCQACQYGAAKNRPHERTNTGSVVGTPTQPGDFVSVDQMIAGSPGLIPFTSGRPSRRRYTTVTMWVLDHFSRFLHAHCQKDATIQSTLESKEAFEIFAKRYNVRV
jgi:hypothetical protein